MGIYKYWGYIEGGLSGNFKITFQGKSVFTQQITLSNFLLPTDSVCSLITMRLSMVITFLYAYLTSFGHF
jgi:hypothetical protein